MCGHSGPSKTWIKVKNPKSGPNVCAPPHTGRNLGGEVCNQEAAGVGAPYTSPRSLAICIAGGETKGGATAAEARVRRGTLAPSSLLAGGPARDDPPRPV